MGRRLGRMMLRDTEAKMPVRRKIHLSIIGQLILVRLHDYLVHSRQKTRLKMLFRSKTAIQNFPANFILSFVRDFLSFAHEFLSLYMIFSAKTQHSQQ